MTALHPLLEQPSRTTLRLVPAAPGPVPPEVPSRDLVGRQVGPFRVLEWLGEGGSAVVFRAARAAGLGSQVVALKLMRDELHSVEAQRRFFREQGILAQLTHPDIARLIEGGVSAGGIPYIAMELVDGAPLTRAADVRQLDLRARLQLFVRVCRAVDAAHAALVVHCDLKPSNVLMDARGAVKVLDFGIARLLGTHTDTDRLSWACTPAYAAPEQLQGEAPTVAIDVHALGLLLGELLTGTLLRGPGALLASAVVRNGGPDALPRGLPPRAQLARRLQGDLDAIIATALAPLPGQRYRSADALAGDVERYLAGHAVQARPAAALYRLRKFVGRHALATFLVATLLLGMAASLGFALLQMHDALHEAQAAQAAASRADALRDFMFEVFADAEPGAVRTAPPTIVDAVERALASVSGKRDTDPRAQLELQLRLAQVLSAQGAHPRAAAALADARSLAAGRLPVDDPLLQELAQLEAASLLARGDLVAARQALDALFECLPPAASSLRIDALTTSALLAGRTRDHGRGLRDASAAVALARSGGGRRLEQALRALGAVQRAAGAWAAAIATQQDLLARVRASHGAEHERSAAAEAALATAYRLAGQLDLAEHHVRNALRIDARVYPGPHPQQAVHLNALAQVQMARRDFDQALQSSQQATRIDQAVLGPEHHDVLVDQALSGVIQGQLGNWAEAARLTGLALAGHERNGTAGSWFGVRARLAHGLALARLGRSDAARAALRRAFELAAANPPATARQLQAQALEQEARILLEAGDAAAAGELLDRLAQFDAAPLEPRAEVRRALLRAEVLLARGAPAAALPVLDRADRVAAGAAPEPVLATDLRLLRALALARTHAADAPAALAAARQAYARLRFPPPPTTRHAALLPRG